MKSDLKRHRLLEVLSKQRQNRQTPIGVPFEDILSSMKIDREYLDKISGELFGNDEIGFFEDYQYKKGLRATKEGVSAYSSEKYRKRFNKGIWTLVKNWIVVVGLLLTIFIQFRYCRANKEEDKAQSGQTDYNSDSERIEQKTEPIRELERDTLKSKDSITVE